MTDSEQDRIKLERLLNFNIGLMDEDAESLASKKQKMRDPMSHRIIEKRRRDRMNNCLADLSQLIPASYLKQGQGRIEKTEIIEMAIKHIKHLQVQLLAFAGDDKLCCKQSFHQGFDQCWQHAGQYLVEQAGLQAEDPICTGLHSCLRTHSLKIRPAVLEQAADQAFGLETSVAGKLTLDLASLSPGLCLDRQPTSAVAHPDRNTSTSELMSHQRFLSMVFNEDSQDYSQRTDTVSNLSLDTRICKGSSERDSGFGSVHQICTLTSPAKISSSSGDESNSILYKRSDSELAQRSAYKFKNDIQHRFHNHEANQTSPDRSGDEQQQVPMTVAASLSASANPAHDKSPNLSDNDNEFKDPLPRNGDNSSDMASVSGKGSSSSTNGNGNNGSVASGYISAVSGDSGNGSSADSLNNTVPAFALHPTGVFYIPLVLPISQVLPFIKHHRPMGICHPISIPVSFSGPFQIGPPHSSNNFMVGTFDGEKSMKRASSSGDDKAYIKKHRV